MRFAAVAVLGVYLAAAPLTAQETVIAKPYVVVTDRSSNNLLRYQTTGAPKDTFAQQLIASPEAVVFGPDQNLYFTSFFSRSVERYNGDTGNYIGRFASTPLHGPEGLAFGPDGNLYVVDRIVQTGTQNTAAAVLRFDGATGAFIDEFVKQGMGGYNNPGGITFGPDGNIYVTSGTQSQSGPATNNAQILRFDGRTGAFKDIFVSANSGGLENPFFLLFGPDGNLYVSSVTKNSVFRYNGTNGAFIDTFIPSNRGGLSRPTGMSFGPDGFFYVVSSFTPTIGILRFNPTTGAFVDVFIPQGSGGLTGPTGILFYTFESQIATNGHDTSVATDPVGNRMVVWSDNNLIKAEPFDANGNAIASPRIISSSNDVSSHPQVISTGTNSFFVAWEALPAALGKLGANGASNSRIITVPIPGSGVPAAPPKPISQPPSGGGDTTPTLTSTHHNLKVAVVWNRTNSTGAGTGLVGRVIGSDNSTPTGEVQLSSTSVSSDEAPSLASDGENHVSVAWRRRRLDGTATIIASGVTDGDLNATAPAFVADDGSAGTPGKPSVTANSAGRVLLAVSRTNTQATSGPLEPSGASSGRIVIIPIGGGGQPLGPPVPVSNDPNRNPTAPRIRLNPAGNATVVWQYQGLAGGTGVFGRSIDTSSNPAKSEYVITDAANSSEGFNAPDVAVDANGNATVSTDKTVSGGDAGVFTRTHLLEVATASCTPSATSLCLNNSRYRVTADWRTTGGQTGNGQAVPITSDTGYFWFFGSTNVEMVVKVIDACSFNQRFWVFAGGLTDVNVTLNVTDTKSGVVRTYTNPLGVAFQPIQDTNAFATCP